VVRDLAHILQNPVRVPREHAAVVRDRAGANGDQANLVSENDDFAAELERVAEGLDGAPVDLVVMAQNRTTIDLSLDAAAPERAAEGPHLESGLAYFFRLPLTGQVAFLAS
jgi:hypothetical protein